MSARGAGSDGAGGRHMRSIITGAEQKSSRFRGKKGLSEQKTHFFENFFRFYLEI